MTNFDTQVYTSVKHIPAGYVATYGDIAKMAGMPSYSRHVGKVLSRLPKDSTLPWYRIINSKGEISLQGERGEYQKKCLQHEGILVSEKGKISLKKYRYNIDL